MADERLLIEKVCLVDCFPGSVNPTYSVPQDGIRGASHHNVASPAYPVGTKIQVKTGMNVCRVIYLKQGTPSATAVAAGTMEGLLGLTGYTVTNDKTTVVIGGPACVALSAMTTDYYGWFWCGGFYPDATYVLGGLTSATANRLETDNTVVVATSGCALGATAGNNCGLKIHAAAHAVVAIALANDVAI